MCCNGGQAMPVSTRSVLQWWASNASQYPQCAALVRLYLLVPATSVLSERQFSAAGHHVSKL